MKKLFSFTFYFKKFKNPQKLIIFFFLPNVLFAQIAIDTVGVDNQAMVDIASKNKAVLFPRIEGITDLNDVSFLKEKHDSLIPNGLFIYNESSLPESIQKGFYYWDNNKWNFLINSESVYSRLTIDHVIETRTTAPTLIKNFFGNDVNLPIVKYNDEIVVQDGFTWLEMEGLDHSFEIIENSNNNVFVKMSGTAQYAPSNYNNLAVGISLGIFLQSLDDEDKEFKLKGISSRNLDNVRESDCTLFAYNIQASIGELTPGRYRIKSFVAGNKNYNNSELITNKWVTVGGKSTTEPFSSNSECANSSNDVLIARQIIVISSSKN